MRGAEKLGYSDNVSDLKVVLEADGTEVEDDGYFQTAEKDTIFILLRPEESWLPLGVEALKTALSAIPGLVSEALNKLEASDKLPNWKVADNNGIITVVLSWDTRDRLSGSPIPDTDLDLEVRLMEGRSPESGQLQPESPSKAKRTAQSPPILKTATPSSQFSSSLQQTGVITSQSPSARAKLHLDGLMTAQLQRITPLPEIQHSFYSGDGVVHMEYDTDSDEDKNDQPSPTHDHTHCDFHCSALHRQIQIKKSVATSPIVESIPSLFLRSGIPSSGHHFQASSRKPGGKYVRFQDEPIPRQTSAGSDSETETTDRDDEQLCERYLLLVDTLSIGHERHLTIKDIGCILERLSCKIVDVDKLERESETADCHNWLIRALIRGDSLREIGVVYNSQYFGIIEHPGYF